MKFFVLIISLMVIVSDAQAQVYGCFTKNLSQCVNQAKISCSYKYSFDALNYGYPIAFLCDEKRAAEDKSLTLQQTLIKCQNASDLCDSRVQELADDLDACIRARDRNVSLANQNYNIASKNKALIKKYKALEIKLRAVCAAKCKRIKL